MKITHLLTAAVATLVLTASSVASAADNDRHRDRTAVRHSQHTVVRERVRGHPSRVVVRDRFRGHPSRVVRERVRGHHRVVVRDRFRGHPTRVVRERFRGRPIIARTRVVNVLRGRHIRFIGVPYFYGGLYVVRCYDNFGRLAYCRVDPYSGAFLGFTLRL